MEAFAPLKAIGCGYEQAFTHLYAIDVPPAAALAREAAAGVWDWEAGSADTGHEVRGLDREDRPDDPSIRHRRRELNSNWVRLTLRLEQDEHGSSSRSRACGAMRSGP